MNREQEEVVMRITAAYVAELQAGQQPRLGDYLRRYPQYADMLTDFVTYYHAVEAQIPEEAEAKEMPALSAASCIALQRVTGGSTGDYPGPITLQAVIRKQHLSFSEVAASVGLSVDILEKLVQRSIDVATLPQEMFRRLAQTLRLPLNTMSEMIGASGSRQPVYGVAESAASYGVSRTGEAADESSKHMQSFREAMEQSSLLPEEQKEGWRAVLAREGL